MIDLITEFWKWLAISREEYILRSENPQGSNVADLEEYMFPLWNELLDEAKKDIVDENKDSKSIDKVLNVMALDNENEDILDYVVENAGDEYIEVLVQSGVCCPFFHTRWQIAEVLGRRHPRNWEKLLEVLCNDPHAYVSKRAENIIEHTCK